MYQFHKDGDNAWILTKDGCLVGHVVRTKKMYRASTVRGIFMRCRTLRDAEDFLRTHG